MAFPKGYIPWNKGKTHEELYGDQADAVKAKYAATMAAMPPEKKQERRRQAQQAWSNMSLEKKQAISTTRRENALLHNAQKGRPHSNPEAVSAGVQKYWDENGTDHFKGEGNPNWKGGPKEIPYNSDEWRQAAGQTRRRDHNTCQDCGQVGDQPQNRIEVHHIDIDAWNHALDNLVTLCRICHGYRHGKRMMKRTKYNNPIHPD